MHSCGAEPEHTMHELLVLFIRTNFEEVNKIARSFLRRKGLNLQHYLEYIEKPSNRGHEFTVHLLAMMQGVHYCIITKNNINYSTPNVMPSPSAVHITLVYLGNKVFQDTTVSKKDPPQILFKQELPLSHPQPPTLTPRKERQRKWDERRAELPDAQESTTESEKEKEEKSPPHPKKHKNKKPKVVKCKEYKIWQTKKEPPSGNVLMFRKFQFPKRTQ